MSKIKIDSAIDLLVTAWRKFAPTSLLWGMTVDEFVTASAPSVTVRSRIRAIDLERKAALATRTTSDVKANELYQLAVNAIKGSPEFGEDSEFYRAIGYKTKSERKSGLTRKKQNQPVVTGVN